LTKGIYVKGLDSIPPEARGGVLTIGNFDGVHMGHQRILLTCRTVAGGGTPVVVVTFDPLPEAVLLPKENVPPLIYPVDQNAQWLLRHGADVVAVATTTRELLALTPRQFVEEIIVRRLKPRHVVEGANFFFGRGRTGDVDTLEQLGAEHGFDVTVVDPVVLNMPEGQRRVSSTMIRELILEGRIEDANYCLARDFTLRGQVVAGEGRGKILEFPTANLEVAGQVIPADGVYAGRAEIDGVNYIAAVSIGHKPTFTLAPRTVEAFLIDAQGDFYGHQMALTFKHRLREQQKFEKVEALRQQIARDVEKIRKLLG
jgi:riboflavin kinase/FMN adenylyltransferase